MPKSRVYIYPEGQSFYFLKGFRGFGGLLGCWCVFVVDCC